jgi:hypothetical protein
MGHLERATGSRIKREGDLGRSSADQLHFYDDIKAELWGITHETTPERYLAHRRTSLLAAVKASAVAIARRQPLMVH